MSWLRGEEGNFYDTSYSKQFWDWNFKISLKPINFDLFRKIINFTVKIIRI